MTKTITERLSHLIDSTVLDGLKFSECLPEGLAKQVFKERFKIPKAIETETIRSQPIQFTVEA